MFAMLRCVVTALAVVAATVGATAPAPAPSSEAPLGWCDVAVGVATAPGPTTYAFGLTTPAPSGRASGTLSIFTGTGRYDVRFTDVVVPHVLGDGNDHSATPIVVRFERPVFVQAAVITALDGPTSGACKPFYSPYSRSGSIGWTRIEPLAAFAQRAAGTVPVRAPVPVPYAAVICEVPYSQASTLRALEPHFDTKWSGDTTVLVTVDVDGRAMDAQVDTSSGHSELDAVAVDAARRSLFKPATFDCAPVVGTYRFIVTFDR
ncbi:MAG: Gram-negative bacterial TonB protein C-terminal [Candidatus Eremiobacteraeota bacterium]|jgi:TonB family protein|nr:Gram-negative bacterial TonB protein C-terminal [Candidatus Eremiobacteraeota bacterium]